MKNQLMYFLAKEKKKNREHTDKKKTEILMMLFSGVAVECDDFFFLVL